MKLVILFFSFLLFLTLVFSITYSYLAIRISGAEDKSTIVFDSGYMNITYNDKDSNYSPNIIFTNAIPGVYVEKIFTLTGVNTSNKNNANIDDNMYYKIGIVVTNNTFSEGALTYTLTKDNTSSNNAQMANGLTGAIPPSGTKWIGAGYFTPTTTKQNHVYNLKIEFPETGLDQSDDMGAKFSGYVTIEQERTSLDYSTTAVDLITYLYNNDPSVNGLEKDNTIDENIRYVGSEPRNYVSYNNELWRIIGIFNVANEKGIKEKKVKLIRNEKLGDYSWDVTNGNGEENGYGSNDWTKADLMLELNGDYLDTTLTSNVTNWYNAYWTSNDSHLNDRTGAFDYTKVIKSEYQTMISTTVWNTGGNAYDNGWSHPYQLNLLNQYNSERGNKLYSTTRTTTWTGKIGLMYISDYGYASLDSACREDLRAGVTYTNGSYGYSLSNCKNYNWLYNSNYAYQWTLSPYSGYATYVFNVNSGASDGNFAFNRCSVRPSLYLKSDIKILRGDGRANNPYILG